MANEPHGGILKVCTIIFVAHPRTNPILTLTQDLLLRDEPLHAELAAEAAKLPEIILTEVCLFRIVTFFS